MKENIVKANVDYEIMTKCIATQLKVVLAKIMNEHQFGFMKGRYIRDNIRSPLSVNNLAEDEISLVFYYPLTSKKLLMPSVGNSYIKYLAFFYFGDTFQQWIAIFFSNNIFSCVLHTG